MTVFQIADRIQHDLNQLRALLEQNAPASTGFSLRSSYTARTAAAEKERIEAAFLRNEVSYDKKRGLKMMVTKLTDGWSPVKAA